MVLYTTADNGSSVNNEMLFVAYDAKAADPVTYPDYRYVCDVYVDSTLVARLKAVPDPTHDFGRFDVSRILQAYATYGLKADYSNATETYDKNISYRVKIGEEYNAVLYTNILEDSSDRTAWKSYANRPFTSSDIVTAKEGLICSNRPQITKAYKSDKWLLAPFFDNASGVTVSYNFDDGTNIIGSSGSFTYSDASKIMQMNIGFQKLSAAVGLTNTQKEQVRRLLYDTGIGVQYLVEYICTKYPIIHLAWLNPYGAYDSQSFGLVSRKQSEISRKEYQRLNYEFNASGEVSYKANGVYYGSKKTYATTFKHSLKLTSHILTDDEYQWLSELFHSPDVYMYDESLDAFVPVTVMESGYEYRTYLNSRLRPLEFTINFTDTDNGQML